MADEKTTKDQLAAINETIQASIKQKSVLGEIADKQEEITLGVKQRAEVAKEIYKFTALLPVEQEKLLEKEQEEFDLSVAKGELLGEELKFREAVLELKSQALNADDEAKKELQKQLDILIKQEKVREKNLKNLDKSKKRLGDIAKRMGGILGIGNRLSDTMTGGLVTAAGDLVTILGEAEFSMENFGENAKKAAANIGDMGLGFVIGLAEEVAVAQDGIRASFIKSTGATGEFSQSIVDASDQMRMMGLDMRSAGEAGTLMYQSVTAFRDATPDARREAAVFVGTLIELGINGQSAAQNMQLLTMGMGQTFDQAIATTKSLRSFAISIDMDVNQAMDDFNDLAPELIAHGSKMDKVFKGLMKISRKTGLSMQTLVDVAGQFDTFEGAATAVGRLNGMLGGQYLNSIEMVYASEEDRLKLMQQAMRASGRQFKDLSRYEKKAVAAAAGFKSVGDAMYFFNKEAMDPEARRAHMESIENQKNLAEQALKTKPVMERLQLALMKLTVSLEPLLQGFIGFVDAITSSATGVKWFVGVLLTLGTAMKIVGMISGLNTALAGLATANGVAAAATGVLATSMRLLTYGSILGLVLALGTLITMLIVGNSPSFLAILGMVTVAVWAMNLAMNANPIGLIVIAVAAAIGALYLLYTHFEKVKGAIMSLFEGMATILTAIFSAVMVPIKATINLMIGAINFLVRMANKAIRWIPGVPYIGGSKGWQIEYLAKGTSNFAGGPAIVGEKGPELVYLEKGTNVASNEKTVAAAREAMGVPKTATPAAGVSAEALKAAFVAALKEVGIGSASEGKIVAEQPIEVTIGKKVFGRAVMEVVKESTNLRLKPGAR